MMRRRPVRLVLMACALVAIPACSSTGSHALECDSVQVSPNSQPGSKSPEAALDWYLKNGKSDLPRSGFTLESHDGGRAIFSRDGHKVSVTSLPTSKEHPEKVWIVSLTYTCT
jgi:hypothetical protein